MIEEQVRIVELPADRMVRFHGFGSAPEDEAFASMFAWTETNHYLDNTDIRIFGFNNPDPMEGSPNYGYEIWLTIPQEVLPTSAEIVNFSGGTYAVARCKGKSSDAGIFIPEAWQKLSAWVENSNYRYTSDYQWLEEQVRTEGISFTESFNSGEMVMDLYLPVKERS